jgi:hypothetical protein
MEKNACCKWTAVVESYKYHTKMRNQSNGTAPVTETAAVQKDSFGPSQKNNGNYINDQGWAKLVWNLTLSKRKALVFLKI